MALALKSEDASRHILLLSSNSVSEHSVVCNGFQTHEGVVLTASHCLSGTSAIAISGSSHSYCTMDGWDVVSDIQVADLGDDLGKVTWGAAREAHPAKLSKPQVGPVQIVGYGPNNGDGGLQCQMQSLSSFRLDDRLCSARPEWETEHTLCLISATERVCSGWSGSAVMQAGELIGIVSGGSTCSRPMERGILIARAVGATG